METDKYKTKRLASLSINVGLLIVTCCLLLAVVIIVENYLYAKYQRQIGNAKHSEPGRELAIRLSLRNPNGLLMRKPSEDYSNYPNFTSNLEDRIYSLRSDSDGFIIPSAIHEHPDVKIVFLGGSTTECGFVDEDKRFPFLVGRILESELGLKINSYNSGVSGNDSIHSLNILLNKLIPMKPDIVVLMHNVNDLSVLLNHHTYWPQNSYLAKIIERNGNTKTLPHLLLEALPHLLPGIHYVLTNLNHNNVANQDILPNKQHYEINPTFEKLFEQNILSFVELCRIYGVTPVLMTQQNRIIDNPEDKESWQELDQFIENRYDLSGDDIRDIYRKFQEIVRKVANDKNVLLIDIDRSIPKEGRYIYDWLHFTNMGSVLAANVIAKELKPIVLDSRIPASSKK